MNPSKPPESNNSYLKLLQLEGEIENMQGAFLERKRAVNNSIMNTSENLSSIREGVHKAILLLEEKIEQLELENKSLTGRLERLESLLSQSVK